MHFGGKSAEKSGLLDSVRSSLKDAGVDFVELGGVHPNPLSDLVYEGIEFCKKNGVDSSRSGHIPRSVLFSPQLVCLQL